MHKVSLISLGCPKNLVDSEDLLKKLSEQGISHEKDPDDADLLLINTCGFIEDARRESIEEILKLAETIGGRKLVVFGCLAKRSGEELKKEIPRSMRCMAWEMKSRSPLTAEKFLAPHLLPWKPAHCPIPHMPISK